jgi:hypothetical protein
MANLTTGELNAMSPSEEEERVEFEKFEPKTYGGMFDYNPDEEALKNKKSQGMPEKAVPRNA